jgi:hypothetical protein
MRSQLGCTGFESSDQHGRGLNKGIRLPSTLVARYGQCTFLLCGMNFSFLACVTPLRKQQTAWPHPHRSQSSLYAKVGLPSACRSSSHDAVATRYHAGHSVKIAVLGGSVSTWGASDKQYLWTTGAQVAAARGRPLHATRAACSPTPADLQHIRSHRDSVQHHESQPHRPGIPRHPASLC